MHPVGSNTGAFSRPNVTHIGVALQMLAHQKKVLRMANMPPVSQIKHCI
jgi:hypothetical protein